MSALHSTGDMPQITGAVYGTATTADWSSSALLRAAKGLEHFIDDPTQFDITPETPTMPNQSTARRIVQVFIADPDPNVPLTSALLYKGEPKFTDATDQELYFEVPLVQLLDQHNAQRVKWPDREASKRAGKDVLLEPARVRDLRMVVVTVATF